MVTHNHCGRDQQKKARKREIPMTSAGCLGIGEFTFDIITLVAKTRDSVLPDYLTTKTRNITKNDYVLSCHVQIALKIAVIDYQKTIIFEMMLNFTAYNAHCSWRMNKNNQVQYNRRKPQNTFRADKCNFRTC